MVVLWILVILSLLAMGLGRRTGIELALAKHSVGKLKAKYTAVAGLVYAIEKLQMDSRDEEARKFDSRYQCGFLLQDGQSVEAIFKERPVGEGHFSIAYVLPEGDEESPLRYGMQDEESRININGITSENYMILGHLLMSLGYEEEVAREVASSVIDWKDEDDNVFNSPFGAEEAYYQSLEDPYVSKNRFFDSVEELMFVRGMNLDTLNALEPYITVFPVKGSFRINFDTASRPALLALARYMCDKTNTGFEVANSLVEKMISYRSGADGREATADDQIVTMNELGLLQDEFAIYALMEHHRVKASQHFRIRVKGYDRVSKTPSRIEAVVDREGAIFYWHRS